METKVEKEVGTIVLVISKTKSEYSQDEIIQLSKAIDPMVDKFDGYLGRKMAFSNENQDLVDIVYYTNENAAASAAEKELKSETCQKFFATMEENTEKMWTLTPAIITDSNLGKAKTLELVLFKTKPEYNKNEVIQAGKAINAVLEEFDGYISRKLAITKEGEWMDLVYWTDLQKAKDASKEVMGNEICKKYFAMIDEETMQFMHLNTVIDTEQLK